MGSLLGSLTTKEMVDACTDSLKVALTVVLTEALIAPAAGSVVGEGRRGQQRPRAGPEVRDMRARVLRARVEADAGDGAGEVGAELDAQLAGRGVGVVGAGRDRARRPDAERPGPRLLG